MPTKHHQWLAARKSDAYAKISIHRDAGVRGVCDLILTYPLLYGL